MNSPRSRGTYPGKRILDFTLALIGLLVLALPLAVIALLVLVTMGRPVLFRQRRPGFQGKPFEMIKFRTMACGAGDDAQRLTPFGKFLRGTSLDELPELVNVLKGEMSLVGPRPLLMEYLPRYTPEQARRHEAVPGITGWAQINGRNAISWDEKFAFDVWYVDNASLGLDLRILGRTLGRVLKRDGIAAEQHATMPEFQGRTGGL